MADTKDNTGARVKELRTLLGLTQREFAARAGFEHTSMPSMEAGSRAIGPRILREICNAYGVRVEWLTTGTGDMFARGVQHNVHGDNIQGERATVTRHAGESEAQHLRTLLQTGQEERAQLLDLLRQKEEQARKKDEQIDRLLALLEKLG